jgi:maleate cis-trans isomerase
MIEREERKSVTVGILYPGFSAEDDYPTMERLLGNDVRLPLVHTDLKSDDHRPEAMKAAGDPDVLEKGANKLASEKIDSIMWACTSGSFAWGWEDAQKQVEDLTQVAHVPASSTSFAFVDAVKHLNLRRVAIAATYPENLATLFKTFLAKADIEVVQLSSRGIFTATEVGATMRKNEVLEFAASNDHPDAEAVLIPDTAMHSVSWLPALEKRVGKPVLTANQVTVWQGIRLAGGNISRPGLGTLFR